MCVGIIGFVILKLLELVTTSMLDNNMGAVVSVSVSFTYKLFIMTSQPTYEQALAKLDSNPNSILIQEIQKQFEKKARETSGKTPRTHVSHNSNATTSDAPVKTWFKPCANTLELPPLLTAPSLKPPAEVEAATAPSKDAALKSRPREPAPGRP